MAGGGKGGADKATPEGVREAIEGMLAEGKVGPEHAADLVHHLMGLTVAQIGALKKEHGVKASGAKAELAKKVAERVLAGGGKGKGKPEPKPEPKVEDDDNTIDLDTVERLPDGDGGKPAAKDRPKPRAPAPGFTGTDSLGRKWVNGELVPGAEEPLEDTYAGPKYDEARRLKLADLGGGEVRALDEGELAALKLFSRKGGAATTDRWLLDASQVAANRAQVESLVKAGLVRKDAGGDYRLTDHGAVSLAFSAHGLAATQADPKSRKQVTALSQLYVNLSADGRDALAAHFGLDADNTYAFQRQLTEMAERHFSPPIARRIREAKEVHDVVAELSNLPDAREARDDLARERHALEKELPPGARLDTIDSDITYYKSLLGQKRAPRGFTKAALRVAIGRLEGIRDRAKGIGERARSARDEAVAGRHEAVASALRAHVTDAHEFEHEFVSGGKAHHGERQELPPEGRAGFDRGMALLKGVLARTSVPVRKYEVFHDSGAGRAYCEFFGRGLNMGVYTDPGTAIHEVMHGVEADVPEVGRAVRDFLAHRVGGEVPTDMGVKFGTGKGEMGRKDDFDRAFDTYSAYYVGRDYGHAATEVLSMGAEKLFNDPAGFCAKDPEYATFIIGVLTGKLRHQALPEK